MRIKINKRIEKDMRRTRNMIRKICQYIDCRGQIACRDCPFDLNKDRGLWLEKIKRFIYENREHGMLLK